MFSQAVALSLFICAAADPGQKPSESQKVALLVGVGQYDKPGFEELPGAENDAMALGAELKKLGFDVHVLLGGGSVENRATLANLRQKLKGVTEPLTKKDILIVALAGHGQQLETSDAEKRLHVGDYFCPVNAVSGDPETMLPLDEVLSLVGSNVGRGIVLVDACRDEPDDPNRSVGSRRSRIRSRGIQGRQITVPSGISILFSCAERQRAFEHPTEKHGLFTFCLLEELRKSEGNVVWLSLANGVTERMASEEIAKLLPVGRQQTPVLASNVGRVVLGDSPFRKIASLPDSDRQRARMEATKVSNEAAAVAQQARFAAYQDVEAKLRILVKRHHIRTVKQLLDWLPTQGFPQEFQEEVKKRVAIAREAIQLAQADSASWSRESIGGALWEGLGASLLSLLLAGDRTEDARDLVHRLRIPDKELSEGTDKRGDLSFQSAVLREVMIDDLDAAAALLERLPKEHREISGYYLNQSTKGQYLLALARRHFQRGDVDQALTILKSSGKSKSELQSGNELGCSDWLGEELYWRLGAADAFAKAKGIDPGAEQYIALTALQDAAFDREKLATFEPLLFAHLPDYLLTVDSRSNTAGLASAYVRHSDFASAARVLRQSLSSGIDDVHWGDVEMVLSVPTALSRPAEATELADLLLQRNARSQREGVSINRVAAALHVAIFYARIGKTDEARRLFAQIQPQLKESDKFDRGIYYLLVGDPVNAWPIFEERVFDWFGSASLYGGIRRGSGLPRQLELEALDRYDRLRLRKTGADLNSANQQFAAMAARLGYVERAKPALSDVIRYRGGGDSLWGFGSSRSAAHVGPAIVATGLVDFGWQTIKEFELAGDRMEAAASLANAILFEGLGLK